MATEAWIESACRTDEELLKRTSFNQVESGHIIGLLEEEPDPVEQALAARWLRRERPQGWMALLEALGLPEGSPLTRWEDDPAACLEEAHADEVAPAVVVQLAPQRESGTGLTLPSLKRRGRPMPRPDWNWQDDALCCGEDLILFFGPDGERQPERDIRERKAKAVCAQCPVRTECLDYALSRPEKYGTWAGLNEDERASERRRRMRRAAGAGVGTLIPQPVPPVPGFKRCHSCRTHKPVEDFGPKPKNPDGLNGWCLACVAKNRTPTWARSDTAEEVA